MLISLLLSQGILFLQGSAAPHKAAITHHKLADLHFEVLKNPAYSPDFAPSDHCLFPNLLIKPNTYQPPRVLQNQSVLRYVLRLKGRNEQSVRCKGGISCSQHSYKVSKSICVFIRYISRSIIRNLWMIHMCNTHDGMLPLVLTLVSCSAYSSTLMMETICSSETSVNLILFLF
jgi:hypothetical protein